MESKSVTIAKFPFNIYEGHESVILSPLSKHLLRITVDRKIFLYSLLSINQDKKTASLIWHDPSLFISSCMFSQDEKHFITISKEKTFLFFSLDEAGLFEEDEIQINVLQTLFNTLGIDLVTSSLELVCISEHHVVLLINNSRLMSFEWESPGHVRMDYCIKVTGSVVSVTTVKNKAFCLTRGGEILIYSVHDGILDNVFNIHMVLPNVSIYTNMSVNQTATRAALLDQDNIVYIFDISVTASNEVAPSVGPDESSHDGSESVVSFQTNTSFGSTYSRIGSGSVRSSVSWKYVPTVMSSSCSNSSWMVYLNKLRNRVIADRDVGTSTSFVCIRDIPRDLSIQHVRFLHGNLRIWCTSSDANTRGLYRLYDINTGEAEMSEPLNATTHIVPVDCPGISLDLLFQGSHLTVPLGSLSKEDFVYKILHCVGSDCLEQVLQVDSSLAESMQPLPLLQDAIVNGQVDLVRLSLNLHAQGFKSKLLYGHDVTGETERIMDAMTVVVIEVSNGKVQFNKEVQRLALSHANTLLALLQDTESVSQQTKHELQVKIMTYVIKLREGLFKSDTTHVAKESNFNSEWLEWEQLSDRDIVRTAISRLPLVHWYLHKHREWSSKDMKGQKFKELVISLVTEMLEDKHLDKAKTFLRQAGYRANEELQTLCANSLDSAFRDYLVTSMYNTMEPQYTEAWKFLKLLEDILERNSSALTEGKADIVQKLPMSICDTMRLTAESRTQIITDLYFNTWDSVLLEMLDKEIVWDYLFYQNCVEGLLVWLGEKTDTEVTLLPWPVELFAKWDVTNEMIDRISQFDCTDYAKDVVLDYLATQGRFTSAEKNSVQAVMTRLAHTKNITHYESILNSVGSNINCTDFYYSLLEHAVDNNLVDLVINVIPHSIVISCKTGLTERCSWLKLWKLYCQVSNTWTKEETLTIITETAKYLSSGDLTLYLEKHPLVAVMISLLQNNELSRQLCSVSPLLEASIETEPKCDDVTVYSLLSGTIPFNTDNLFQFQNKQKRNSSECSTVSAFRTFSDPELCKQYGHKQTLEYTDYLKQGRPSIAIMHFCTKQTNTYGHLSKRIKKKACNVAHGLAVQHFANPIVTSSCIAFMEMLGRDSICLRTHLVAANLLQSHKSDLGLDEHYLTHLLHNVIVGKPPDAGFELLKQVEKCHLSDWNRETSVARRLQQFYLEIKLADVHNLPFPIALFKHAACRNEWLVFLLAAQLFQLSQNQVQQLLVGFNSSALREHLSNALNVNGVDEDKTNMMYLKNTGVIIPKHGTIKYYTEEDLFGIIAKCGSNAELMLELSRTLGNPPLALLAVCIKPDLIIPAFATWLVTSLPQESLVEYPSTPWTADKVTTLLEMVVKTKYFCTLAHAFLIFFPNNPLHEFANFLVQSIMEKKMANSIMNLKLFKATCINLPDEEVDSEGNFISNKQWIATTAMRVTCTALAHCFPSLYHQNCFLKVLCQTQFADLLPVTVPDMCFMFKLSEFMAKRNYMLDYSRMWIHNDTSQLNEYLAILVKEHCFEAAFEFASIANVPVDTVYLAQCKVRADSDEANTEAFWHQCNTALRDASVQPSLAAEFFRYHTARIAAPQVRYVVLKYTIEWIKKMPESEVDQYLLHILKVDLYQCALSDGFDIEVITKGVDMVVLKYLRKDVINDAAVKFLDSAPHPTLSAVQRCRLDDLIYRLLEVGDLATACNLQFMFKHRNQDCELILTCMSLAEGDMKPHRLPDTIQDIINKESTPPPYFKPKLPVSSSMAGAGPCSGRCCWMQGEQLDPAWYQVMCFHGDMVLGVLDGQSISTMEIHGLFHMIKENRLPSQQIEQQSVLDMLYLLKVYQTSSTAIFDHIICAYKVACALSIHYKEVIVHEDPLNLLNREDNFDTAQCIFMLANLSQIVLTEYIAAQVAAVIAAGPGVNGSYILWQCNLDADFSRLISSAGLPVLLGNLLITAVPKFDSLETKTHRDAVELVIRAHECYTKSCNMEGIATVLTMSRMLVNILNNCCQWALMVRLLTGVGRYTEMTYIFQILKENEQFEFLLGKGLDKYPGLMSSLLEFVRNDKGLFSLVALHFHMYADLAVLFELEARAELNKLEMGPDSTIVSSELNKKLLQVAMDSYAHATEHYMQAKKLKRAVLMIQQAELVALQLSFLNTSTVSQNTYCLINLTETQAKNLINTFLSFDQACIVERAYDLVIDWSTALYHHCVLLGSTAYLNAWCQHHQLTSTVVQDVARRFQMEGAMSSTVETNMKWFVSSITHIDIKYRVASQLAFKDILQSLLSGPDVAYLKDTVWQSGCKRMSI